MKIVKVGITCGRMWKMLAEAVVEAGMVSAESNVHALDEARGVTSARMFAEAMGRHLLADDP